MKAIYELLYYVIIIYSNYYLNNLSAVHEHLFSVVNELNGYKNVVIFKSLKNKITKTAGWQLFL